MKKYVLGVIITVVLLISTIVLYKKVNEEEKIETKNEMTTTVTTTKKKEKENVMDNVTLNYHASIRIEKNNKVIYFDPFKIEKNVNDANYIFITHDHYDHYSESDIKKVMKSDTKFVITNDLESKVLALGVSKDNVMVVYPNETHTLDSIKFDTITAYNIDKSYHKKSYNWLGYNVNLDGVNYYVVGDSDVTEEMKKVKCDVIFIPVGGTYTMSDKQAAILVNEIKPKYAVPTHYGVIGSVKNAETFINSLDKEIKGVILNEK